MPHRHQLTDPAQVATYFKGGKGRFTLVSKVTGNRFTYRLRPPKDAEDNPRAPIFVAVLTAPDNDRAYSYVGCIWPDGGFKHGRKSRLAADAPSVVAINWFTNRVAITDALEKVEFWHEGVCGACGRTLTVPESIERGIGPKCAGDRTGSTTRRNRRRAGRRKQEVRAKALRRDYEAQARHQAAQAPIDGVEHPETVLKSGITVPGGPIPFNDDISDLGVTR